MNCRSCGGATILVCHLGNQPLANALLDYPQERYETHPLDLLICESCYLGQLAIFVPPDALFNKYAYYTSVSKPSIEAAGELVARIVHSPDIKTIQTVVEIGSNDGYLLRFYRDLGIRVLGIDPARGPAQVAIANGIPTVKDFFTHKLSHDLPKADIIHANNVLAHVPDLNDFVAGIAVLLKPDGVCFVEVPYFGTLLEQCSFDTIYHEHFYYFSFKSLDSLFLRHGLFIGEMERLPGTHGGSLRLRVTKHHAPFASEENLAPDCKAMQSRMDALARDLRSTFINLRKDGLRVWGYAAAAKATVMMNYCGLDSTLIDAIADETTVKIGKYIPGTGVRIRYPDDWLAAKPDYTCIFAWNYNHYIVHRYVQNYRGVFFSPHLLQMLPHREVA